MKVLTLAVAVAFALSTLLASEVFAGEMHEGKTLKGKMSAIEKKDESKTVYRSSELLGKNVKNEQGEEFGAVEELLFTENGRIKYVILARGGGILGGDERLVPVPWKTVKTGIGEDEITLSLDKSFFDEAPSLARSELDKLTDPEWNKTVHSYYKSERKAEEPMSEEREGTMMEKKEGETETKSTY
jgi:sporulation protein YlmC with PRC-barrel domain